MSRADGGRIGLSGLAQLAARRVRADAARLVGVWLVLVVATSLIATGVQYADAVATASLQRALVEAPGSSRGTSVSVTAVPAETTAFDTAVRPVIAAAVGSSAPVVLVARSSSLIPVPSSSGGPLVVLGGYEDLAAHARLTAGRWPESGQQPVEATLSEGAAKALGVGVGQTLALADAATPGASQAPIVTVVVTGTWTADAADTYWLGDPLDLAGTGELNGAPFAGPLMVDPADLRDGGLVPGVTLTWRAGLVLDQLAREDAVRLEQAVRALPDAVATVVPTGTPVRSDTRLAEVLGRVDRSLALAQGAVQLLLVQFVVLAGYAVVQLASLLSERRRRQSRLLEVRGSTGSALLVVATFEAILLAAPAVAVAPFVAALAVHALAVAGPLRDAGVELPLALSTPGAFAAAAAGVAAVAILAAPAIPLGERVAAVRLSLARDVRRFRGRQMAPDLGLLAVALVIVWQLRLAAAPAPSGAAGSAGSAGATAAGVPLVLAVGPAIALLAGSLLATRELPRVAAFLERGRGTGRRLALRLAVVELARRPQRATTSILLVILAAAMATFALTQTATWYQSQSDQAAYRVAADVRAVTPAYAATPEERLGAAYRAITGVQAATPVVQTPVGVGGAARSADLLAVDAARAASLPSLPGGADSGLAHALAGLAAARPTVAASELSPSATWLAVTLDAKLLGQVTGDFGEVAGNLDPATPIVSVAATVIDGDGYLWQYTSAVQAPLVATGQRLLIQLGQVASGDVTAGVAGQRGLGPLRLEALDIIVTPPDWFDTITGTIDVRTVATSDAPDATAAGADFVPVAFAPGGPGWSWVRIDTRGTTPYRPPTGQPTVIEAGPGGTREIEGQFPPSPTTWRAWATPTAVAGGQAAGGDTSGGSPAVGAIGGDHMLALTGQTIGDAFTGSVAGTSLTFRIAAATAAMPPLDPLGSFVVVDGPTFSLAAFAAGGSPLAPTEWWLSTGPGEAASVATALAAPPLGADAVVRSELEASLVADPVAIGIIGALLLGAMATMLLAGISFALAVLATIDARVEELDLVRALGVSGGQANRMLIAEQAVVLLAGLLVGALLGAVTAWLALPASTLTSDGQRPVPDPAFVVPWDALAVVALAGVLLLVATAAAVARRVRHVDTARALRGDIG